MSATAQEVFSAFDVSVFVWTEPLVEETNSVTSTTDLPDGSSDELDDDFDEDLLIKATVVTTKQAYTLQTFIESFESEFLHPLIANARAHSGNTPLDGREVFYELLSVSSTSTAELVVF